MLLQGCPKGYLYAGYALIYEVTMQDNAWNKKDVEPEEMWFGVFFYPNKDILHRCRSPPLEIWKIIHFQISEVKDERREKIQWF